MRLIDADDLKKYKVRSEERCEYVVPVYNIDNAPTVFAYTEDDMYGATADGYEVAKRQFERPKGEWKHHNSYFKRCSVCQKITGFDYIEQADEIYNFCPNCGAQMIGGDIK